MPILLLIRHGENDYLKTHRAAGRLPGVHLNERGRQQAEALAQALAQVPLAAIYSSPLERAVETAEPIARLHQLQVQIEPGLIESDVGSWQGRPWKELRRLKAWLLVQHSPSRFRFPDGESFLEMQVRVVTALERILTQHQSDQVVACVFHADPIKLAITHYLGLPLDHFQRLACDPGSVTVIYVDSSACMLLKLNLLPPFTLPLPEQRRTRAKAP